MAVYNAPLNDMRFMLNDVFRAHEFWQSNDKQLMSIWILSI